jgi:hypothetical protein
MTQSRCVALGEAPMTEEQVMKRAGLTNIEVAEAAPPIEGQRPIL